MGRSYIRWFVLVVLLSIGSGLSFGQSTGSIQGTVTDTTGAVIPGATVTVQNVGTSVSRTVQTDSTGRYFFPNLVPGPYTIKASAPGLKTTEIQNIVLRVATTLPVNIQLGVSATQQTIQITAQNPVVDLTGPTVGQVIDQKTVQEAPLNGRHFVDLGTLIPGSVTAPANGFLTQPIRGQGALSFDSAGQREDTVNFMINGINLNDMVQNQITFQPTINTVAEFKVDNSTFSAEFGRDSGAVVNIATRSGTNEFHGEAYNYLRNTFFDARNYFNRQFTVSGVHVRQSQFIRNQYGGDFGGPIWKNHTFAYLSYEGVRQRQGVSVNSGVPPAGSVGADSTIQQLLKLLPAPNSGNIYVSSASAIVAIDQGTIDLYHQISQEDQLHGYYAIQKDSRNEPLSPTVADTIAGYGDTRPATRQIMTLVETHIFSSNAVNEARLGFNRIHISFTPAFQANPATYGIDNGIKTSIGLPQITISGLGLTFGGPAGEPQGRGDTTGVFSDTFSLLHGNHSLKFGGEFRRFINSNYAGDTSTFSFNTLSQFLNDEVSSFNVTPGTKPSRVFTNALGVYAMDSWHLRPNFTAELGFRFDWNGTPVEAKNRFVVFQPASDSLVQAGQNGLGRQVYQQNLDYGPHVGFSWDVFGHGKMAVRGGYAIFYNQPETNLVTGLSTNPPFAVPVFLTASTPSPSLTMQNAFSQAKSSNTIAPYTVNKGFRNPMVQSYNLNIQNQLSPTLGLQVGYIGSTGSHLQMLQNLNQPINGARPFPTLSASSPIYAGASLSNILESNSGSESHYNALWVTLTKTFSNNLQFNTSYTWAKSQDDNSYSFAAASQLPQNSYNPHADYGLSDFDVRNRWVFSGVYYLPFKGNRIVQGWEFSTIASMQTGNPFTVHTTLPTTGVVGTIRPNLLGHVPVSYTHASNGNIQYMPQAICNAPTGGCLFSSPGTGFGDLRRNTLTGPGFVDVDFSLIKNTALLHGMNLQLRADAFNLMNHPNFGQPNSTFTPTGSAGVFGQIGSTRFPIGDFGSSRQLQVAAKIVF
ncbi:MAG: TonB-dependent receptor [Acidobacteriaceae bacterium]